MLLALALVMAVQISPAVPVESPANNQSRPRVACGPAVCLVAWQQDASVRAVRVRRSDRAVLDAPARVLAESSSAFDLTFDGDEFIHVWQSGPQIRLNRLRAPDGAVLDSDGQLVAGGAFTPKVGCRSGTCLVIWGQRWEPSFGDANHTYGRRWRRADATLLDPTPLPIATTPQSNRLPLGVAAGSTDLLATAFAGRFGEVSTGAIQPMRVTLDGAVSNATQGLVLGDIGAQPTAPAFDGEWFMLATAAGSGLRATRMHESTGSVENNMGQYLGSGSRPQLAFDGRNQALAFVGLDGSGRGKLLRPSDLTVIDDGGGSDGFMLSPAVSGDVVVAGAGAGRSLWAYAESGPSGSQVYWRWVDDGSPEPDGGVEPPPPPPVDAAEDIAADVASADAAPEAADTPPDVPDAATPVDAVAPDARADAGAADGGGTSPPDEGGCSCDLRDRSRPPGSWLPLLAMVLPIGLRRLRSKRAGK